LLYLKFLIILFNFYRQAKSNPSDRFFVKLLKVFLVICDLHCAPFAVGTTHDSSHNNILMLCLYSCRSIARDSLCNSHINVKWKCILWLTHVLSAVNVCPAGDLCMSTCDIVELAVKSLQSRLLIMLYLLMCTPYLHCQAVYLELTKAQ